jgi:hypothetical protein
MKIRTGFVSNSSSSSFVLFVLKDDYDKVVKSLSKLEKDILSYTNPQNIKAFGKQLVKLGYVSGNYSTYEDYSYDGNLTEEEQEKLDDESAGCIMDEIIEKLNKGDCLTDRQDF